MDEADRHCDVRPDRSAADAFWARHLRALGQPAGDAYTDLTAFGSGPASADALIELVLTGPKRATAGGVAEYEADGTPLPAPGDRWIACDGRGRPRAVLRTTWTRIGPMSSVDDDFARDEGEGDRTRGDWLQAHRAYFTAAYTALGLPFDEDSTPIVFERFEVLYTED